MTSAENRISCALSKCIRHRNQNRFSIIVMACHSFSAFLFGSCELVTRCTGLMIIRKSSISPSTQLRARKFQSTKTHSEKYDKLLPYLRGENGRGIIGEFICITSTGHMTHSAEFIADKHSRRIHPEFG